MVHQSHVCLMTKIAKIMPIVTEDHKHRRHH